MARHGDETCPRVERPTLEIRLLEYRVRKVTSGWVAELKDWQSVGVASTGTAARQIAIEHAADISEGCLVQATIDFDDEPEEHVPHIERVEVER